MKAIISTEFKVRDKVRTTYHSFTSYSTNLEETMVRSLGFLENLGKPYRLTLEINKNNT